MGESETTHMTWQGAGVLHYRATDANDTWLPLCWRGGERPKGHKTALMTSLIECVTCRACEEWMHA